MASLLEALSHGFDTAANKDTTSSDFARNLQIYKMDIVNKVLKYNADINKSIAQLALKHSLNIDQIHRVIEEVNNQIYLIKYNQLKSNIDRRVEFDIASMEKIKSYLSKGSEHLSEQKTASTAMLEEFDSMEKIASTESTEDNLNFLNSNCRDCTSYAPDAVRSMRSVNIEKIARHVETLGDSLQYNMRKIAQDTGTLCEAFIKLAQLGVDVGNELYGKIFKRAHLDNSTHTIIKKALNENIEYLKTAGTLPEAFELNLQVPMEQGSSLSLGEYSFLKQADDNNDLPSIIVNDKDMINSLNKLVSLAQDVKKSKNTAKQQLDTIKHANKTLKGNTTDNMQKMFSETQNLHDNK